MPLTMIFLPQEVLDTIVDLLPHKSDLISLSLTHSCFLPRSRWHLFSVIRLFYGGSPAGSSLNYRSTAAASFSRRQPGSLPIFLTSFQYTIARSALIVPSVRTLSLSLHADAGNRASDSQSNELPDPDDYLPFTNLQALQVRFSHSYYDIIDVRTTQKWRLPRLTRLIEMNSSSLQHLVIDTCSLEGVSWDYTLSSIAGLADLHTLVLRLATIASKNPGFETEGSILLCSSDLMNSNISTLTSDQVSQPKGHLKKLFLEENEPEFDREAISTEKYFSLAYLDAFGFKCHLDHNMWGLRAVLLNIGRGLTSLTIQMDILNSIDLTLRDLVFPNLEWFQLISNWLAHDVYTVFYWLVHQSTPTGNPPAHPTLTFESDSEEDRTNKASSKLTNLRFIHLTFGANPSDCHRADSELNDLISATPSLEEITADVTMREYGIMAFSGEECLNRYFPRVYATGRLRHGKVDRWWEVK